MARRKKRRKTPTAYEPAGQARRLARALLGPPPAGRVLPSKKKKPPKHKKKEFEHELEG